MSVITIPDHVIDNLVLSFPNRQDAIHHIKKKLSVVSGSGWNKNDSLKRQFEELTILLNQVQEMSLRDWNIRLKGLTTEMEPAEDENGLPIFKVVDKGGVIPVLHFKISVPPLLPILTFLFFLGLFMTGTVTALALF